MAARGGYSVVVFLLDISPSMGEAQADPGGSGVKKSRLHWAKEYMARICEDKVHAARKTDHVGVVTFGGNTNNDTHNNWVKNNPDDDQVYNNIASEVAIQSTKPKLLEAIMNAQVGQNDGNPVEALLVALDMIQNHKHSKMWTLDIVLLTDGETAFEQDSFDVAMDLIDKLGVRLTLLGLGFEAPPAPVSKDKSRNKRLSEKFWRTFIKTLHDNVSKTTESDSFLPKLHPFEPKLITARRPRPATVNGTLSQSTLWIGSEQVNDQEVVKIPFKFSKATMKARPPSLSKAWKAAVEMQNPNANARRGAEASQMMSSIAEMQSQAQSQHQSIPQAGDLASMLSAEVKRHPTYFIKRTAPEAAPATQGTQTQLSQAPPVTQKGELEEEEEEEEDGDFPMGEEDEVVDKEDIVKAYRFGSSWIPMEADTFDPLRTQKGVEVIGFIPQKNIRRYMLMGEVRYMWPDQSQPKAQIQFSSFVEALMTTGMAAITRWVYRDGSDPDIGVAVPDQTFPGEGKKLDLMYWARLPYADDEHKFYFPSLTKLKTAQGKDITEHPYIPTKQQCDLMDELVKQMDLDTVKPPKVPGEESEEEEEDEDLDEDSDMEDADKDNGPKNTWFNPARSVNPSLHRIKEAIFHSALTPDLDANPLPPPHPELTQYMKTPEELGIKVEKITEQLKAALDIKKVPPRTRKRAAKEGMREDEGFIDIDELFAGPSGTFVPPNIPDTQVKNELLSPSKPDRKLDVEDDKPVTDEKPDYENDPDFLPSKMPKSRPKPGRLISNEQPLQDFRRLVDGDGDVFRKAIQDLGVVVKENVAASFSHSAFPLALKCLEEMRSTALTYEETETYNDAIDDLERTVKGAGFKHPDFWDHFDKAGKTVAKITPDEAMEALEDYDE